MYEFLVPLSPLGPHRFASLKRKEFTAPGCPKRLCIGLLLMGLTCCLGLSGCGGYVLTKAGAQAGAAAGLSVNASSVSFGSVVENATATQTVALNSVGTGPVTISEPAVTGAGFTVSVPGASFPLTLDAGQTAIVDVQFVPTAAGAATGQLVITSNAATNSKTVVALSGTGEPHEVQLSWSAPTASKDPVIGYYIFRSTGGGSYFQLISSLGDPETTYTDTTIQGGQSYDYLVKSYDSSGTESAPSNTISVTIP